MSSISTKEAAIVESMLELAYREPESSAMDYFVGREFGYTFEDPISGEPALDYMSLLISLPTRSHLFDEYLARGNLPTKVEFEKSVGIIEEMLLARQQSLGSDENIQIELLRPKTNCSIFLQYNMFNITEEMRESIRFLVQNNLIDCLIIAPQVVEEDLIKCFGPTYARRIIFDHTKYRGFERIGDFLVPEGVFCEYKAWIMQNFPIAYETQEVRPSRSKVIERLGLKIDNEDSICYWAAKNKIPIFCTEPYLGDLFERVFFLDTGRFEDFSFDNKADSVRMEKLFDNTGHSKRGIIVLGESGKLRTEVFLSWQRPPRSRDPLWFEIDYAVVSAPFHWKDFDFMGKFVALPHKNISPRLTISFTELSALFPIMIYKASSKIATLRFSSGALHTTMVCLSDVCSAALSKATRIVNEVLKNRKLPAKNDGETTGESIGQGRCPTIILEYIGNGFKSGHRRSIRFLVKHKLVDYLVMDEDFVSHDLGFSFGNSRMSYEDIIIEEQETDANGERVWPTSKIIERLGLETENDSSICYWAAKNNIPIYSEGFVRTYYKIFEREESVINRLRPIRSGDSEMMVITVDCNLNNIGIAEKLDVKYRVIFRHTDEAKFCDAPNRVVVKGDERVSFPLLLSQTFLNQAKSSE